MRTRDLDERSLAVFRIALGGLVFAQAIQLSRDFEAFYGSNGVKSSVSFAAAESVLSNLIHWGIPLFAAGLIIGLWTRLATLLCLVGTIIVQEANPMILQGGDVLLRLLLFWSVFLPLGRAWSVDSWKKMNFFPILSLTTGCASWALVLQICSVYWFACALKQDPLWTRSGNALYFALNLEHFTAPFGLYLRQFPEMLRIFTFGTILLEAVGPCLLFIPYHQHAIRLGLVTAFIGFHLIGMEAVLRIGIFPWVCAIAWLVFIPTYFWEWLCQLPLLLRNNPKRRRNKSQPPSQKRPGRPWTVLDRVGACFVALCALDVLCWNIASVTGDGARGWMRKYDLFGRALKLQQRWNMYAPHPQAEHGWLVVPATLANDEEIDLFTGLPLSWEKPSDIAASFRDDRWRRYLSNLFVERDPQALEAYAIYLTRRWNEHHSEEEKIQVVTIVFMRQITLSDLSITPPERETLYYRSY